MSYLKLYILMYADNTVLLAESPEDLQKYLDTLNEHSTIFDCTIKTSRPKTQNIDFVAKDMQLDVVNDHIYLGVTYNFNAKCIVAKQNLNQKGCKPMFHILCRSSTC